MGPEVTAINAVDYCNYYLPYQLRIEWVPSVCWFVWICETYAVHHYMGTGLSGRHVM